MNHGGRYRLAVLLFALGGCSTIDRAVTDRQGYYTRNLPDLNDTDVRAFAERQNNLWNCFVSMAQADPGVFRNRITFDNKNSDYNCPNLGAAPNVIKSLAPAAEHGAVAVPEATVDTNAQPSKPSPPVKAQDFATQPTQVARYERPVGVGGALPSYAEVVAAGINYADVRCDRYMDALFWFNRVRETSSREIQYVGAASAAALTLLKAGRELIGLTPLGIGLADQTVNNIGRGLLYDLPPYIVRQLVEKQQQAYLQAVAKEYTSRAHAMQTIQGYAALCLPATIETEVNRAIAAAEYKPIPWDKPDAPAQQSSGQSSPVKAGTPAPSETSSPTTKGTPPPNNVPAVQQTGQPRQ